MPQGKQDLNLTVHHRSDRGRMRDLNEDYLGYRQPKDADVRAEIGWLYAVADGVGGAQEGEVASRLAVQTLLVAYYRYYHETPTDNLIAAFAEANRAVRDRASRQEGPHRMSTTLVAAVIHGRELTVANVGDSRAYLIHDGQIRQITRDHSMVAQLAAEDVITPEQAKSHPQRHLISRNIGGHPEVDVDVFTDAFLPGDRLLLCTDGLTDNVTDAEILAAMQARDPEDSVQHLVNLVNQRGGPDNITLLVVRALRQGEDRLPRWGPSPEIEKSSVSKRLPWPWIGAIAASLLICAAGSAAGALLLFNPTPTPTPTATAKLLQPSIDLTTTATMAPTPAPTDTQLPTETPLPDETPTTIPLPTQTETMSPTATETLPPTPTRTASPTLTATLTPVPTATSTSEISPLPTPTNTPTLIPTPTGTTEGSPLSTPSP
jgi:serine/threonine protein phosphatase PrpC